MWCEAEAFNVKSTANRTPQVNGQDHIVQSGNYCYSSLRVASINKEKYSYQKITMTPTQTICPNHIALHTTKKGLQSAEDGVLAPVFEKSATELKHKQKLLNVKAWYIHHHHHHHDVRLARISPTLSLHVSLSFIAFGRSSGLHPVSSHSCCMNVWAGRPAFDWPYAGGHRSTSLTISSLLLQQCPA